VREIWAGGLWLPSKIKQKYATQTQTKKKYNTHHANQVQTINNNNKIFTKYMRHYENKIDY